MKSIALKDNRKKLYAGLFIAVRVISFILFICMFIPAFNPARITTEMTEHVSLLTCAVSFDSVTGSGVVLRLIDRGVVQSSTFIILMLSCVIVTVGIMGCVLGSCFTLGNCKAKKVGNIVTMASPVAIVLGLIGIVVVYNMLKSELTTDLVSVRFEKTNYVFFCITALCITAVSIYLNFKKKDFVNYFKRNVEKDDVKFSIDEKYTLFLYALPALLLTFLFSYLPLFGWRYAFFDYTPGSALTLDKFVGFKWFKQLFNDPTTQSDFLLVMRNTLIMSGLGIATSFLPALFAVLVSEIGNKSTKKIIQTLSTLPYFISWVLVYTFAQSLFSTNGLLNKVIEMLTGNLPNTNYLQTDKGVWFAMLTWGVWKSLGWNAIIYIAAITGIDRQLYEAAAIDGATRKDRILKITIPSLLPTYGVMLLMSIAGILSNGLEQYLVFENPINREKIRVLDLYVYRLGIGTDSGATALIPFSTVISIGKSVISIMLLFFANWISKKIRGESIF